MTATRLDWLDWLQTDEDAAWELYHVNSKTGRYDAFLPSETMAQLMRQMPLTFAAASRSPIVLPEPSLPALDVARLSHVLAGRATPQNFRRGAIELSQLATILYCAYGQNRTAEQAGADRGFRTVPSGGALFPLELYINVRDVAGLEPGFYHYDPTEHALRLHMEGDQTEFLKSVCVQKALPEDTSLHIVISALPQRSTIKYGERGYRFTVLEAGHASQNAILASRALGLEGIPVGGYYDEELERHLGFDGLNQIALYLTFVGYNDD